MTFFYITTAHIFLILLKNLNYCLSFTSAKAELRVFPFGHEGFPEETLYLRHLLDSFKRTRTNEQVEISNLNNYTSSMKSEKCLVVVDNFEKINVVPENTPVILRNPHPVAVESKLTEMHLSADTSSYSFAWAQQVSHLINQTFTRINFTTCPFSKFLSSELFTDNSMEVLTNICLQLNPISFPTNSKPWNCQQQFEIYPPLNFIHDVHEYSVINVFSKNREFIERYVTISQSVLQVFIIPQRDASLEVLLYQILERMVSGKLRFSPGIVADVFVLLSVHNVSSCNQHSGALEGKIVNAQILKICSPPACPKGFAMISLNIFPSTLPEFWKLSRASVPSIDDNLGTYVDVVGSSSSNFFLQKAMRTLMRCTLGTQTELSNKRKELFEAPSRLDKLGTAFATLWHEIMGNYTLLVAGNKDCFQGKVLQRRPDNDDHTNFRIALKYMSRIRNLHISPFPIPDPFNNLRFIGCGSGSFTSIKFLEFINVFDRFIWVLIFTSIVIIALQVWSIISYPRYQIIAYFIHCAKVILEQGDPFPGKVEKSAKLRFVVGPFLIMGIVISNAYKNTNVYNMIIPREPVLLETFQELMTENFTVYTRTTLIETIWVDSNIWYFCRGREIFLQNFQIKFCVHSFVSNEVGKLKQLIYGDYSFNVGLFNQSERIDNELYTSSKIVSSGLTAFAKVHPIVNQKFESLDNTNLSGQFDFGGELETLQDAEGVWLRESLKMCKNVALILPEFYCRQLKRNLTAEASLPHLSVGAEVYSEFMWHTALYGFVPLHILHRFNGVGMAGIWNWWIQLFTYQHSEIENTLSPIPVSIKGNVVMVFSVLLLGLGAAILCYFWEIRKVIAKCFILFWGIMCQSRKGF